MIALKSYIILLCLLLLFPMFSQAQSNYKPGYVVTVAGDTLRGNIDYREWDKTPASVSFKSSAEDQSELTIDPSNFRYFEISGMEAYQRYKGPITMNPVDMVTITDNNTTEVANVTVFLKIHQKGQNVHLLSYTDHVKTRFFYQENDGNPPQELYYSRYYTSGALQNHITTLKGYTGQLQYLASAYGIASPKLKRKIENATYQGHVLNMIISLLNGKSEDSIASHERGSGGTRYFAGAALSSNIATVRGDHIFADGAKSSSKASPRFSVGADIFVNRHVQKFFLRAEASISLANYTLQKDQRYIGSGVRTHFYEISQQTASLTSQLIYNVYNKDNFKVYAGLAANINYSQYSDNTYTTQYSNPKIREYFEPVVRENYLDLVPFWISFAARTGIVVNRKYELTASYAPPIPVTRYIDYSLYFSSFSVGVHYLFNKY